MTRYVGRFAPSPSGPLHFGSLVAALGSYFQAKANQGIWLVRVEDLDPPREVAGAKQAILQTLQAYQLHWDGDVIYQSDRHDLYQKQIDMWLANGDAYYCQCTRKQVKEHGGFYPGTCQNKGLTEGAIRLKVTQPVMTFFDLKHGKVALPQSLSNEDFIIKRRDGLFAYNLAVVLDDIDQGITEVVRGADLIEPTGRQIHLYRLLDQPEVSYLHLPLAIDKNGNKLSKQNHATAIDVDNPKPTLLKAMMFLGFTIPDSIQADKISNILEWGCQNWHLNQLPLELEITT
ncbi:tRNA glutamyl-Q(34) synthetase GluQRS [Vibrio sagamiensis]|uniref:Glutamyl-Q tRNA(Asp) synthetase n=1 Tax=Vibrio sagamiensis NBRC 104589 TaxID=1219064 RepID=A0A511Q9M2_9VIBR|nr:tRNA glutamyl-Q(34) synthetase GluQRS [Vibrio sagamiensis]PNQ71879.1 glutamyl-Q tRNA(Asp) ligase [Vibrio agarivorans]GEM73928.1 glutamyl-Q tRNA(Asp) synthetase [Vibrio sagamiensis NBRC 104589]